MIIAIFFGLPFLPPNEIEDCFKFDVMSDDKCHPRIKRYAQLHVIHLNTGQLHHLQDDERQSRLISVSFSLSCSKSYNFVSPW